MKKSLLLSTVLFSAVAFSAENAPIVKMAVFPNNNVFTVRKGIIPDGKKSLNFFEEGNFFKGSFSLWSKDISFALKEMPRKTFNANVYSDPNSAFAGQNVVVTLKSSSKNDEIVSGKMIKIENPENPYEESAIIAVQDNVSKQITYIRTGDIKTIRAAKADFMHQTVPADCWIFSRKNSKGDLPFEFSYLSGNIAWQSAVELHLTSRNRMNIIHNAVIRNSGKKFTCPDFYLVSGSPEIATQNILSLLCTPAHQMKRHYSPTVTAKTAAAYRTMNDAAMYANAAPMNFISQSSDVFYRRIGNLTMDKNESRLIKLQSASDVPFRTIAKWDIAAQRNVYGRVINSNKRQRAENTLIFKNLCPSMLDAAPLAIYADGKLIMLTEFKDNIPVNAERSVCISAADGIECKIEENELVKMRIQNVVFNNRRYVKCTVEAALKITNFRKIAAPVAVNYNFNGQFVKCEGIGNNYTEKSGVSSLLNPAGKLSFETILKPAESKNVKVTYTFLTNP